MEELVDVHALRFERLEGLELLFVGLGGQGGIFGEELRDLTRVKHQPREERASVVGLCAQRLLGCSGLVALAEIAAEAARRAAD